MIIPQQVKHPEKNVGVLGQVIRNNLSPFIKNAENLFALRIMKKTWNDVSC